MIQGGCATQGDDACSTAAAAAATMDEEYRLLTCRSRCERARDSCQAACHDIGSRGDAARHGILGRAPGKATRLGAVRRAGRSVLMSSSSVTAVSLHWHPARTMRREEAVLWLTTAWASGCRSASQSRVHPATTLFPLMHDATSAQEASS